MPEPKTALGWAYSLHDHLTRLKEYRAKALPEAMAEQGQLVDSCVARLRESGEQREGMLRALETLETMCAECCPEDEHICPDTIALVIDPALAGAREVAEGAG